MRGIPVWLQQPNGQRWLLRGVGALLVLALGSCFAIGADRPRNSYFIPAAAGAGLQGQHSAATSRVPGFGQTRFRIVTADATAGPIRCALYADRAANMARGMMQRHDFAGYDAMVFRFYVNTSQGFYNKGVPIPLSVAWFDANGVFVGSADLAVCSTLCPTVSPPVAYQLALEVPKGGLRHFGVGQGSVMLVGGHC